MLLENDYIRLQWLVAGVRGVLSKIDFLLGGIISDSVKLRMLLEVKCIISITPEDHKS